MLIVVGRAEKIRGFSPRIQLHICMLLVEMLYVVVIVIVAFGGIIPLNPNQGFPD